MKLSQVVAAYVTHRQAMGMRFHTEAHTLRSFCRASGDVTMQEITAEQLLAFLAGTGPVTPYWERKHSALSGLLPRDSKVGRPATRGMAGLVGRRAGVAQP